MDILLYIIIGLLALVLILLIVLLAKPNKQHNLLQLPQQLDAIQAGITKFETNLKDDFRIGREENQAVARGNRDELNTTLLQLKASLTDTLAAITSTNNNALVHIAKTLDAKLDALLNRIDANNAASRTSLADSLKDFTKEQRIMFENLRLAQREAGKQTLEQLELLGNKTETKLSAVNEQFKTDNTLQRETLVKSFKDFQEVFDRNVQSFNNLQREKFSQLELQQNRLLESTEKRLEQMRETVDEKLTKTLNERLGESFETVGKQLIEVQKGLGEMQTLATDVGGLKKVLSNVKMRGGMGEVQLAMLLEQMLAPTQYEANVRTKKGSADAVEFAIKLPGRGESGTHVYLPIDAKFPKDAYEHLINAYENAIPGDIEAASRNLETTIRKMARDIRDKYIAPPNTTDFALLFLPFEGIYAEVIRRTALTDQLQNEYKVAVVGPATLAAYLNSLQMGFRTLALQQRSSEVWQVLGSVKTEFEKFGGLLQKAQQNIQTGLNQLDDVAGTRSRAIARKLKDVEAVDPDFKGLPDLTE